MKALWSAGMATVHEIRARLMPNYPLAYTTVMTVMDRLARKGVVEREKRGRAHLYRPAVAESVVSERALQQLVENFFHGSPEELRHYLEGGGRVTVMSAPPIPLTPNPTRDATAVPASENQQDTGIDTSLL